jgi:hypothetical protein
MMPQLSRMVQAEFKDMDRLLQAAVNVMSMKAVTAPSPSKAEVKMQKAGLMMDLAEVRAELAVTRHSLDAEVTFQNFSANMSENFPHILPGNFPDISATFCHFLPFSCAILQRNFQRIYFSAEAEERHEGEEAAS